MATAFDHTVDEPLNARLRLRADLRIEQRRLGGRLCFLIEDPIRGKFYRLGVPEYRFTALLDGTRTIRTAVQHAAVQLGELAFSESEALAICHWLLESELVENPGSVEHRRLIQKLNERPSAVAALANPLSIRIPLFHPSKLVATVEPWLRWTLRPPCVTAWLVVLIYAAFIAAANWSELVTGAVVLLDRKHWIILFAAWFGLKLVHETYHAIVCQKYGGAASQAGILLLFFAPVPYVDVTSSWRFASKWQRIATAAAGMYVELFMAALAMIVWANTANGTTRHVAISIAAMASVGTLVINANPLMRFDGYFIFADLLDVPNLSTYSRRWCRSMAQWLLGSTDLPAAPPIRFPTVVKIYSVAAIVWKAVVWGTILTALLVLLARFNTIVAIAAAGYFAVHALYRSVQWLAELCEAMTKWSLRRLAMTGGSAAAILIAFAYWLLGPATVAAPAIVDYRPLYVVRSSTPGFVKQIYVHDGAAVSAGDKLFLLENAELRQARAIAELDVQKSMALCRSFRQAGQTAREQAELSRQLALEKKRDELSRQLDALLITAPASGHVLGRRLGAWLGRYVETGTELVSIGDERAKEIVVAVAQDDVELFRDHCTSPFTIRFSAVGIPGVQASNLMIDPRAMLQPPHEAFSSRTGGPLAVVVHDDLKQPDKASVDELLDPCFKASLPLSAEQSGQLRAGLSASVEFRTPQRNGAGRALLEIQHWFERRIAGAE